MALVSFKNKTASHDYAQRSSDEFRFDLNSRTITGRSENWNLERAETGVLAQGELQVKLALHKETFQVEKSLGDILGREHRSGTDTNKKHFSA